MSYSLRKRGKHWHFRGTVPARQADGRIARVRIEESLRTERRTDAAKRAADLERYYHGLAYGPERKRSPTFAEAAITYLETVGKKRFVHKLVLYFKETPIDQIDQAAISSAAHALYPGCSASTHNRAVFAPVTTILRMSGFRPDFKRPKIQKTQIKVPPEGWFDAVLPRCPPRLAALLVFLTLTGRRITEALEATWNDDASCTIQRTKAGGAVVLRVPDLCRQLLGDMGSDTNARLFPYGDRHNVYRALRAACKRAGVPYYGTHAIGRHAFATRLLKQGKSLKFVQDAGGWASIKMPAQHYAHLEHSEVQDEVREVGEEWGRRLAERRKKAKNG
jgi:integrase